MSLRALFVITITAGLMVAGCGTPSGVRLPVPADLPEEARSILAGEWEYEDQVAVSLQLDEHGNGPYEWKEGRFETVQFWDHTWVGHWYQKENDREGGFLVKLSPDYRVGEGTWWYARIGSDHAPSEKGGTFHLRKKASLTNLSGMQPAP